MVTPGAPRGRCWPLAAGGRPLLRLSSGPGCGAHPSKRQGAVSCVLSPAAGVSCFGSLFPLGLGAGVRSQDFRAGWVSMFKIDSLWGLCVQCGSWAMFLLNKGQHLISFPFLQFIFFVAFHYVAVLERVLFLLTNFSITFFLVSCNFVPFFPLSLLFL